MSGEMMEREMQQLEAENAELLKRLAAQQHNAEQVAVDAVATIESSARIWRELVRDLRKENEELQIYRRLSSRWRCGLREPRRWNWRTIYWGKRNELLASRPVFSAVIPCFGRRQIPADYSAADCRSSVAECSDGCGYVCSGVR